MNQKRQYTRLDYEIYVELVIDGEIQHGHSVNISQGGVFVRTDPVPPFGTSLKLRIKLPGVPDTCEISCIVRWSKTGEGVGLQFEQLRAIEVWGLNKLVGSLNKS